VSTRDGDRVGRAAQVVVGDPFGPATTMGALINARQRDRVLRYIGIGRDEGPGLWSGEAHHHWHGGLVRIGHTEPGKAERLLLSRCGSRS
jgi:acyl-CoA reductase-like NAD-dependent aldehyde dehydrogenase